MVDSSAPIDSADKPNAEHKEIRSFCPEVCKPVKELLRIRATEEERRELENAHLQCEREAQLTHGLPFTALAFGAIYKIYTRRPASYFSGLGVMKYFHYASLVPMGFVFFVGASTVGMESKCKVRVQPKVAQLWEKYDGAKWMADYQANIKRNQEAVEAASLVPETTSVGTVVPMAVGTVVEETKPRLSREQIDYLWTRMTREERSDVRKDLPQELVEVYLLVGSALVVYIMMNKTEKKFGVVSKTYKYITIAGLGWMVGSAYLLYRTTVLHHERRKKKMAQLWKKYGGDESTANHETPSKGNRGGSGAAGLVPENNSMSVDTEKRANVDDTNAPRVRYPARQQHDCFAYSDTLISGTPSGVSQHGSGKFAYSD